MKLLNMLKTTVTVVSAAVTVVATVADLVEELAEC